ncbi:hypothetical protein T484DRAFT_1818705 [Baffinella frigidus]|nr:hypothetical protein T484DRAFT_1818705 [Cryptophyta sp. CCMP2293]
MADGYGAVPQHEHIVYIKAGSDSRRPRTPVLAILFATAAVAAVAAVTILGQPQGSASSGNLVELLGADGVRQFAQYTGLSEQGAVSMLETTLIGVGAGPPGGNVDNLDVSTNIAKADKYLGTDSDEAKLMTHIEGGVVTAAPAESFFDPDANVRQDNVCGGGTERFLMGVAYGIKTSRVVPANTWPPKRDLINEKLTLCLKRDEINEKLTELLNKLRVSLLPANRTVVSLADAYIAAQALEPLADAYIAAQETYLLTESNYRDAVEQKGASCGNAAH